MKRKKKNPNKHDYKCTMVLYLVSASQKLILSGGKKKQKTQHAHEKINNKTNNKTPTNKSI